MCTSDTFVVIIYTSFAVVYVEISFILHGWINCTIHLFQFDCREIEHCAYPFRGIGISRVDLPAIDKFGRTGEQTIQDMIGKKHVQRVMPTFQGGFVPIQLLICFSGNGFYLI